MGIGSRLKEVRENKEITLDQLQDTTKIQKRYLRAIEEENFSILPGKFYARAFIKEYANAVGLNANELLEEFKEDIPSIDDEQTTQYTRINRSRKDNLPTKNNKIFSLIPTIIVVLLIIGIIFAAWWFSKEKASEDNNDTVVDTENADDDEFIRPNTGEEQTDNNEDTTEPDESETNADEVEENENEIEDEEPLEPESEFVVIEEGTKNNPRTTYDFVNPGEEIIISFTSETASWLDVADENGQSLFGGFVNEDNSPLEIDLEDNERVYLNVGSTPNLEVAINGVIMEYTLDPNEMDVQKFEINFKNEEESEDVE
ncbi:helix-turn-helix domain-containing protein [Ornithinibacillus halophilus]|uniref:Protein RodZ, contains Xre-like HTH and DUF4115 domains n=1 Tax=Ornithinibacillus halophilus TaxID=930117 RepID=A0A1M5CEG6_9BACI|nr:helix-turn-helix domain-containing protein [Ornithinibacillus halophilus]SHF53164.1 protein RodZ, contains Xre-like HTH and DUF4115 domains [Ornithinibacillus halophilus]